MTEVNNELELLKQKLEQSENARKALISSLAGAEDSLVVLPNKDLHRGMRNRSALANIDVENIPDSMGNPLDRAMARILKAATGASQLTCMWCGLQWPQTDAKSVREHLKHDHPTVVTGWESMQAEVLMQNLQEANDRLALAEAGV